MVNRQKPDASGKPPAKTDLTGGSAELLVAGAAGRTTGGGLLLRLVGCAAGGTAGSRLFLRLVSRAAGSGLVGCSAGRTGPAGQMRKCKYYLFANLS